MHRDMNAELRKTSTSMDANRSIFNTTTQASLTGARKGCLATLDGACIEKLLLHCASALEANDSTLAQQAMRLLKNVASSHGDPNQRLAFWFLSALVARASRLCPSALPFTTTTGLAARARPMTVTELVDYIDLTPWHRFGFSASNCAILRAVRGRRKVHVLDFGIAHCMQWPTLIDALAMRPDGPPLLRITVPSAKPPVSPFLKVSADEVGLRLANFAKFREVPFEFHVMKPNNLENKFSNASDSSSNFGQELVSCLSEPTLLGLREDEALVVNCQSWLRFLPEESRSKDPSSRDGFLALVHDLNPCILTITDEDMDMDSPSLTSRTMACFNSLWIPFDALETFLPEDSPQRLGHEADIGWKIENIIGFEGKQRIERPESGGRFVRRMKKVRFRSVPFDEETLMTVRLLLEEHASGWGMKEEEDMLVLTWKGHNSVFTTAWVPNGFEE